MRDSRTKMSLQKWSSDIELMIHYCAYINWLSSSIVFLISTTDCSFKKKILLYLKSAICSILEEAASRNSTQKENTCINQLLHVVQWWCAQSQQQPKYKHLWLWHCSSSKIHSAYLAKNLLCKKVLFPNAMLRIVYF